DDRQSRLYDKDKFGRGRRGRDEKYDRDVSPLQGSNRSIERWHFGRGNQGSGFRNRDRFPERRGRSRSPFRKRHRRSRSRSPRPSGRSSIKRSSSRTESPAVDAKKRSSMSQEKSATSSRLSVDAAKTQGDMVDLTV